MNAILILALAAGQPGPKFFPDAKDPPPGGIEARKAARDKVLAEVGPDSLKLMQAYGDTAIAALGKCEKETARGIVRLHNSGELARLGDVRAALRVIEQHGEPAGAYVVKNFEDLAEPPALTVFVRDPQEIILAMKDLRMEAEKERAKRSGVSYWLNAAGNSPTTGYAVMAVLLVLFVAAAVRKWRKDRQQGP